MPDLIIKKEEVLKAPIEKLLPYFSEVDRLRMSKVTGEHYRFLLWLSQNVNNKIIFDVGTRSGASAACLAFNLRNKVTSFDIEDKPYEKYGTNLEVLKNITFETTCIMNVAARNLRKADIILLDIAHSGKQERVIYERLGKGERFKGIVIFDDINYNKFNRLKLFFESITRPKVILDFAHHSGTGVVNFDGKIEVI